MRRYWIVLFVFVGFIAAGYVFHNAYLYFAAPFVALIVSLAIRVWRVERGGKWFDD